MLERLVASVDAWAKAAKQKPAVSGPLPGSEDEARRQGKTSWRDKVGNVHLVPLPGPRIDPLQPRMRPGDLGPGIPIPPMIPPARLPQSRPPVLPPASQSGIGTNVPTLPTGAPRLRVAPPGGLGAGLPPGGGPPTQAPTMRDQINALDQEKAELQRQVDKLKGGAGSDDRGQPNARGTYPYYRGHGPTSKFSHEQFQDYDAQMRQKYPQWYYNGTTNRVKPMPQALRWDDGSEVDWHDFVTGGGQPTMTPTELRDYQRQQKLQMQQQRPDLYGAPGTPFRNPNQQRAPQSRGPNAPRGYQVAPPSGPMQNNQGALDSVLRLRQQVPAVGPLPQQGRTTTRKRSR